MFVCLSPPGVDAAGTAQRDITCAARPTAATNGGRIHKRTAARGSTQQQGQGVLDGQAVAKNALNTQCHLTNEHHALCNRSAISVRTRFQTPRTCLMSPITWKVPEKTINDEGQGQHHIETGQQSKQQQRHITPMDLWTFGHKNSNAIKSSCAYLWTCGPLDI